MTLLEWMRPKPGHYVSKAYSPSGYKIPHTYTVRRDNPSNGGGWLLFVDGEWHSLGGTLADCKGAADRHLAQANKPKPVKAAKAELSMTAEQREKATQDASALFKAGEILSEYGRDAAATAVILIAMDIGSGRIRPEAETDDQ